jgi:3-hydroxyacyl-[acyl-carrier-protein] dehydratase
MTRAQPIEEKDSVPRPLMAFEEVRAALKQRFPMLMIDTVIALELGKSIRAIKNVTGNELQFLGHFPEHAVMPGTLIIEAIGQAASILFTRSTGTGAGEGEFLVLGVINEMRFLAPVLPGDRMEIEVQVQKFIQDFAVIEASVRVEDVIVARGKMGFAKRSWRQLQPEAPRE